jgi:hypothetical protein
MRKTLLAASLALLVTGAAATRAEAAGECWNLDPQGAAASTMVDEHATCPLDTRTHVGVVDPSGLEVDENNWHLDDTFDGGARYERTRQLPGNLELNRYLTVGSTDPSGLSESDDISAGLTYRH